MSMIGDQEIELDQDDFNFIDNISWDTSSLEDSFEEEDNTKVGKEGSSCSSDGEEMIKNKYNK